MNYVLYSVAGLAILGNAYYRYKGGYHFPTDLAVGITYGTAVAILVPALHKGKGLIKEEGFRIRPMGGEVYGFSGSYTF